MNEFRQVHNRLNTHSLKWDDRQTIFQSDEVVPMWVADMDFKAPQEVNDAIIERAEHGIYGYTVINENIQENVCRWVQKRHRWNIEKEWLSFSPGVITSLSIAIDAFTKPKDNILIQTPVYTPFFNLIKGNNRQVVENPLIFNGKTYEIDFEDLERKLKNDVKAFILCSPHNPVGRVWSKRELEKIANLCLQYDVQIFADEIHADLVFGGNKHIPIASLSKEIRRQTITFMSPTKTFNLAGLQASYIITTDEEKRNTINRMLSLQGFGMLNTMGVVALDAAYTYGERWLEKLLDVLTENKHYAKTRLENETNGILSVIDSEGTYLLWIDCSKLPLDDAALKKFMIEKAKVGLNPGSAYGKDGKLFMRMNIACPKETLEEGVHRIIQAVQKLDLEGDR